MNRIHEDKDSINSVRDIQSLLVFGSNRDNGNVPSFTIAIPTFNRASTLAETIESALNQYDFNDYEIIVVDNNPEREDETEILMNQYRNNPKVSYYKNTNNLGMAGNWNKCALLATSNRFVLLHDDDIISPYYLAMLNSALGSINGSWSMIKPALKKFGRKEELSFEKYHMINIQEMHLYNYYGGDCTGAPTAVLFNRDAFIRTGGALGKWYPSFDYVLSYSLFKIGPVYKTDACLGGYRVGVNESLSKKTMDEFFKKKFEINDIIMESCVIPRVLKKSILSRRFYEDLEWVKRYYNMPDYTIDISQFNLYKQNGVWLYLFNTIYNVYNRIVGKLSSKNIIL